MARNVNVDITARDKTKKAFRSANSSMAKLTGTIKGLAFTYLGLHAAIAGVSKLVRVTADYQNFANRLKLVSDNSRELAKNQKDLFDIAQRTRVAYGGSVELFTRMSLATQHLGFDSDRLKGVLETVNQTVAISGSSAQAATAGLIQFSQGLASNRLGGEELRSVMEQIPPLGYAIAEGMGVSIGEFRKLSKEGKLTAEVVIAAIEKMKEKVEADFNKTATTIDHAYTRLGNSLGKIFAEGSPLGDSITKMLEGINSGVTKLQEYLDSFSPTQMEEAMNTLKDGATALAIVLGAKVGLSIVTGANAAKVALWAMARTPQLIALAAAVWAVTEALGYLRDTAPNTKERMAALRSEIAELESNLAQGGEIDPYSQKVMPARIGKIKEMQTALIQAKAELAGLETALAKTAGSYRGPNQEGLPQDKPVEPTKPIPLTEEEAALRKEVDRLNAEAAKLKEDNYMMGVFGGTTEQEIIDRTVALYERLREIEDEQTAATKEAAKTRNEIAREEHNRKMDLEKKKAAAKDRIREREQKKEEQQKKDFKQNLKDTVSILAGHNKHIFKLNQALGIADAIMSTHVGITEALELPFPYNLAAAAVVAAKGFASVSAIASQSYGGGGGSRSAGGGGGGLSASQGGARPGQTQGTAVTSTIASGSASLESEPRDAVNISIEGEGEMSFERVAMLIKQIDGARHEGMTSNIRLVGA